MRFDTFRRYESCITKGTSVNGHESLLSVEQQQSLLRKLGDELFKYVTLSFRIERILALFQPSQKIIKIENVVEQTHGSEYITERRAA